MKIIEVSDLQIWNDDTLDIITAFCNEVRCINPDLLVFNGDLASPWNATWEEITKTNTWSIIYRLCRERYLNHLSQVWVNDEEDHTGKSEYLGNYVITKRSFSTDNDIEFRHGWEFDTVWGGLLLWPGISKWAFWINEHYPEFSIKLWRFLQCKRPTLAEQIREIKLLTRITGEGLPQKYELTDMQKKYNIHIAEIQSRAMLYAAKKGIKLVIGHTHCPASEGDWFWDGGSLVDTRSYLYSSDGNKFELKTI